MTSDCLLASCGADASVSTQMAVADDVHCAGVLTHTEAGRRPGRLAAGSAATNLRYSVSDWVNSSPALDMSEAALARAALSVGTEPGEAPLPPFAMAVDDDGPMARSMPPARSRDPSARSASVPARSLPVVSLGAATPTVASSDWTTALPATRRPSAPTSVVRSMVRESTRIVSSSGARAFDASTIGRTETT